MTAQTPPVSTTTAFRPAPPRGKTSGSKLAAIIAGAVLTVAGLSVAVIGGSVLALFGSDGTVNSGDHALSTSTAALVSEPADIHDTRDVSDVLGNPRVRLSVTSATPGKGVFVGLGPAKAVDRYLAGAPVDEVTDLEVDPFELTRDRHAGSKRLAAPGSQRFWVAQNEGADAASLRWKARDGDYRVVVMNADGTPGVYTKGDVGLTVPHAPDYAWALMGGGFLLLVGGAVATVAGMRREKDAR